MDHLDHRIITWLQNEFPIKANPYQGLADELGISVETLWDRIETLKNDGVIRRLGASLDSRRLGYSSTLAAVHVPEGQEDAAAEVIGAYDEVTHSYQRDDHYNIWFTVIAVNEARIDTVLAEIRTALDLTEEDLLNVPVTRLFKLDARFFPKNP